jgi:murein DD-endopeptidase MepM/ murein hydrolase activator NlpD
MSYQTTTVVSIPPGGGASPLAEWEVTCSQIGVIGSGNGLTPSSHTYPNPPISPNCQVRTPFDAIINKTTGAIHAAQDIRNTTHDIQVGAPVYAPEGGTVHIQSGYPHINQPVTQCAGQGYHANYIEITDGSGNRTRLVHVTALPGLAEHQPVNAGDQVGTVDMSGCTDAPHVNMSRKQAGQIVNFTITGCDNSHFDASGFYDDSDGLDNQ